MNNAGLFARRLASVVLGFGALSAQAGMLTITAGIDPLAFGFIPGSGKNEALKLSFFDPLTVNGPGYGWYGAIITPTDEEQDVLYTYNVFGAEAGFRNLFSVDGTDVYTHAGGNNLSKVSKASYSGSTLNFSFRTNTTGKPGAPSTLITNDLSATTGNNNTTPKTPNFFASFDLKKNTAGTNPLTGDVLWLFLDDGHPVDDNHDDLLVSITATPIPVPTLLPLFGAALGLVSVVRRRAA